MHAGSITSQAGDTCRQCHVLSWGHSQAASHECLWGHTQAVPCPRPGTHAGSVTSALGGDTGRQLHVPGRDTGKQLHVSAGQGHTQATSHSRLGTQATSCPWPGMHTGSFTSALGGDACMQRHIPGQEHRQAASRPWPGKQASSFTSAGSFTSAEAPIPAHQLLCMRSLLTGCDWDTIRTN